MTGPLDDGGPRKMTPRDTAVVLLKRLLDHVHHSLSEDLIDTLIPQVVDAILLAARERPPLDLAQLDADVEKLDK
jgi:transcriptional regulator CtsR